MQRRWRWVEDGARRCGTSEMAESTGNSPTEGHDRVESGRESGLPRPPTLRRDPRADPDDEPSSARVDVFTVERTERTSNDPLTNAALTLRRELAKLHQQAAAVE